MSERLFRGQESLIWSLWALIDRQALGFRQRGMMMRIWELMIGISRWLGFTADLLPIYRWFIADLMSEHQGGLLLKREEIVLPKVPALTPHIDLFCVAFAMRFYMSQMRCDLLCRICDAILIVAFHLRSQFLSVAIHLRHRNSIATQLRCDLTCRNCVAI